MGDLEVVFLDVGGVLYRDDGYREALRRALRELGAVFTDEEFDAEYAACRRAQSGSFRGRLARRFLGEDADLGTVERHAAPWWRYGPEDLEPDAPEVVAALAVRYRLGLIANQPSAVREALVRDGLDAHFEVRMVSDDLGVDKPDQRIYRQALDRAAVAAEHAAMVGDRLDYDIRPARAVGMRAVWMLRGESPEEPTPAQLEEADAAVRSLEELAAVLEGL